MITNKPKTALKYFRENGGAMNYYGIGTDCEEPLWEVDHYEHIADMVDDPRKSTETALYAAGLSTRTVKKYMQDWQN